MEDPKRHEPLRHREIRGAAEAGGLSAGLLDQPRRPNCFKAPCGAGYYTSIIGVGSAPEDVGRAQRKRMGIRAISMTSTLLFIGLCWFRRDFCGGLVGCSTNTTEVQIPDIWVNNDVTGHALHLDLPFTSTAM